jgi:sialate O-acetylesterase
VGYYFAQNLQTNLNVPIGLIDCTVGGTMVESWLSAEVIAGNPGIKAMAEDLFGSQMTPRFIQQRLLLNLAAWDRAGRPAPMPDHPYKPGACWRLGLGQLPPIALKGVLWCQGESNADFPGTFDYDLMARWHREVFAAMVAGWRAAWEQPGLPFYFVQLPRMNRPSWPWFRESQWQCARSISNAAMAVAFEYGETANVHPVNKQPVGERLALIARAKSYGEQIEWSGPVCTSHRVLGASIVLEFDHATGGLASSDGQPLRLFEIAGTNRQFFTATAVISNQVLIVSTPQVPEPVAVRYAWVPDGSINFFNGAGLPAPPFRTDSWPAAN